MDRILSDRAIKIIVVIIGIILVVDVANVFVVGGPSVFSLMFKSGTTGSSSMGTVYSVSPVNDASGNVTYNFDGKNVSAWGASNASEAIYVPTKATPVPTVQYVTEVTPVQTATSQPVSLSHVQSSTQTNQDTDNFALIYSKDMSFYENGTPTAVAFDVVQPPLIINFTVIPDITHRTKVITNRTSTKAYPDSVLNITRPSEFSRFTLTIYDRNTGKEIDQDGYGGIYDQCAENTYTLREAGSYQIQFDGENSIVHVDMYLNREGNIK
ncbi:MAG: hypothetical protein ABFC24_10585 [Methanoregulaceae archaeon]